jgi:hypothetical protein
MADVQKVLEKAAYAFQSAENSNLPTCRQSYALLGLGLSVQALVMIIEGIETKDEKND